MSVVKVIKPIDDRRLVEELADLWRGRGILAVLIKRDIAVRYRQAALGILDEHGDLEAERRLQPGQRRPRITIE